MRDSNELRPVGADDETFLFRLFRTDRAPEFAPLGLPAQPLKQFLRSQFSSREQQYRERYPTADFDLVLHNANAVGNLYAQRGPEEFVLIDITLLPEYRNMGIGSGLVRELIEFAQSERMPLHAHVLLNNPAWQLWQRLGFRHLSDDGVYRRIEVPLRRTRKR